MDAHYFATAQLTTIDVDGRRVPTDSGVPDGTVVPAVTFPRLQARVLGEKYLRYYLRQANGRQLGQPEMTVKLWDTRDTEQEPAAVVVVVPADLD